MLARQGVSKEGVWTLLGSVCSFSWMRPCSSRALVLVNDPVSRKCWPSPVLVNDPVSRKWSRSPTLVNDPLIRKCWRAVLILAPLEWRWLCPSSRWLVLNNFGRWWRNQHMFSSTSIRLFSPQTLQTQWTPAYASHMNCEFSLVHSRGNSKLQQSHTLNSTCVHGRGESFISVLVGKLFWKWVTR